jgi:hypothetical protein
MGVARVNTAAAQYCWLLIAVMPQLADCLTARRPGPDGDPGGGAGPTGRPLTGRARPGE